MRSTALALALALAAAAAAACRSPRAPANPTASSEVDARLTRLEQRLDALLGTGTGGDDAPADASVRLLRVEHRVDQIVQLLKKAVPPELDDSQVYGVPVDPSDPVIGPKDAKVTIIEGYEYLCPYCEQVAATLDQIAARYPKDVRIVSKYYVIHGQPAIPPGKAACAAGKQGKFAAMQKALWHSIWPLPGEPPDKGNATPEALEKLARTVGLDVARFKSDLAGADCADWLERSATTLTRFGASGTPTFYINGHYVGGGMTLEDLAAMVDDEIAKVDQAIAGGVAPAAYYDTMIVGKGAHEGKMITPFD